jgi:hypothetical protein
VRFRAREGFAGLVLCAGLALAVPATALAMPPLVRTDPAGAVGGQSATLHATVTPRGKATQFFFAYGTTKAYGSRTPTQTVAPGNGAQQVSQTVGGLKVGTTYHFRVVATNPDGTASGGDRMFRTRPPDPNALLLTEQPNPVLFGHSAALSGQLLGPNNVGVGVTLMARPASQTTGPFTVAAGPFPTDGNGGYGFFVLPGNNTTYHVVATNARGTTSVDLSVGVVFNVKLDASHTHIHSGSVVTFSGTVFPTAGGVVAIQKLSSRSGQYVTVSSAGLTAGAPVNGLPSAKFSRQIHLHSSGSFRAVVPGTPDLSEGSSGRVSVHVS